MKDLLDKLDEVYQDVDYEGTLYKGKRDCLSRWEMIKSEIKPYDVILDVGSSLGYFSHKIAKEHPTCLVISFESDPVMVEIQKEIYRSEGIYNVIVCQHRLTASDLVKWMGYADSFDTVLALSVLHHFPEEEVPTVFNALQTMSNKIIGEIPNLNEDACGGRAKIEARNVVRVETVLGSAPSHMGGERDVWKIERTSRRENLDAFFGVNHPDRHKFVIEDDKINGREMIKGVNVWNLLHFNVQWPLPGWWIAQSRGAYECLDWKSDVRAWNLLVTSTGLKSIDYMTVFPPGDQATYADSQMTNLETLFATMKPYEL